MKHLLIPLLLLSLCGSAQTKFKLANGKGSLIAVEIDTIKVTVLRKANKISNDTWWPELIDCYKIVKYRTDANRSGWLRYKSKDFKTEITNVIQEWEGFW